jgi:hypothetical protein
MQHKTDFEHEMRLITNTEGVTRLLQKGMPIDFRNSAGNTLLMFIIKQMALTHLQSTNYTSIVSQLISLGADLNVRNLEGKTALGLAFECSTLTTVISLAESREKVLTRGAQEGELEELEEVLREKLESFHAKETSIVVRILLSNGAQFTRPEGEIFYNRLLMLNLNNHDHVYACLRIIESRFVYSDLNIYLERIDIIFAAQLEPMYTALREMNLFPDTISKLIAEYEDPIEHNYLMKSDIRRIFSSGQRPDTHTISAVLQRGLFRSPLALTSSNLVPETVSPSTQQGNGCAVS